MMKKIAEILLFAENKSQAPLHFATRKHATSRRNVTIAS